VRKLAPHAASHEALNVVVDLLLSKKHLSDERFAEERARSLSRKYGAAKIRRDLKSKGISEELANRAAAGLNEAEKAKAILARKYRDAASTREERARRMRFLQSRGFSYDTIRSALGLSSSTNFSEE
jgi:regulatory protein